MLDASSIQLDPVRIDPRPSIVGGKDHAMFSGFMIGIVEYRKDMGHDAVTRKIDMKNSWQHMLLAEIRVWRGHKKTGWHWDERRSRRTFTKSSTSSE